MDAATPQWIVFAVLAATLALFVWDRYRYEFVALGALLVLLATGIVAADEAFIGFGHPAVVTVAAVLVISRGLTNAGAVDLIARGLGHVGGRPTVLVGALTGVVALLSGFMNNIGALALLMPVAIRLAQDHGHPPSLVLMPMAFGSLLGGLLTSIGTPPNLIVAQYRAQTGAAPFALFDFLPVGLGVAVVGVLFLALIGWRWLPRRRGGAADEIAFELDEYVTEVRVAEDSKLAGTALGQVDSALGEDVSVVGLVRGERQIPAHHYYERVQAGDVLIVQADAEELKSAVAKHQLELAGRGEDTERLLKSKDLHLVEVVMLPDSRLVGETAHGMALRSRFGLSLLAVSRQGSPQRRRPTRLPLRAGDVLLLEGNRDSLPEALAALGCVPLASRDLNIGQPRRLVLAAALFATAIAAAVAGLAPIHVALVACALLMGLAGIVGAREAHRAIDWPIVLLLGAMIPVGRAMESSGGAASIAGALAAAVASAPPQLAVIAVLLLAMTLSDIVNNAAAAVLMCPIAIGLAQSLGVSADPFLMAVAVGASSAFLTPVGHQSNTLVMGPGGYRFRDYWPVGLPLQLLVAAAASVLILTVWPL
jgi:di/tricarboxylate transporter